MDDNEHPTSPGDENPASATEPGVAPHAMDDDDAPEGNEAGASSDGDSGPSGQPVRREPREGDTPPEDE